MTAKIRHVVISTAMFVALTVNPWEHAPFAWDWYAGDSHIHTYRHGASTIPGRLEEGMEGGLDWLVISDHLRAGAFRGIRQVLRGYEEYYPKLAPILGVEWDNPPGLQNDVVIFGVDPRSPIPTDSLQQIIQWTEAQGGVFIFAHPGPHIETYCSRWTGGTAFEGFSWSSWNPDCAPGEGWDRILISGRKLFIVGASDVHSGTDLGRKVKTYVWARSNRPEDIIHGIRAGAVYASEKGSIQMDFRVDGRAMGSTLPVKDGRIYVKMSASSDVPIVEALLVANGEVIWSAMPDSTRFEARFHLSVDREQRYLRMIVENAEGYRAMGNPVFLHSAEEGEILEKRPYELEEFTKDEFYLQIDGALEVALSMEPTTQKAILSLLLRDMATRFHAVRALTDRRNSVLHLRVRELLKTEDREVRLGVAYALVSAAPDDLTEVLLELLSDQDERVRIYASRMLTQFVKPLDLTVLKPFLVDENGTSRLYLTRAISRRGGDPVVQTLIHLLRDEDRWVAYAATDGLVEVSNYTNRVVPMLIDSLKAGNDGAVDPLGWIKDVRAIPVLKKRFLQETYGPLKRATFLALNRLGAPHPARKEISVDLPEGSSIPEIDGVLADEEWDKAVRLEGFQLDRDAAPPSEPTLAYLTLDAEHLYLAFVCYESEPDSIRARVLERDDLAIREQDRVEMLFDPEYTRRSHLTFAITPLGAMADWKDGDIAWDGVWRAAAHKTEEGWVVECAIPFSTLGLSESAWKERIGFNMERVRVRTRAQRISWSPTYSGYDKPDRFGDLILK